MIWRWVRVRGEGASLVWHAVHGWPASLDTACGWQGRGVVPVEIGVDGERRCLDCARRVLAG